MKKYLIILIILITQSVTFPELNYEFSSKFNNKKKLHGVSLSSVPLGFSIPISDYFSPFWFGPGLTIKLIENDFLGSIFPSIGFTTTSLNSFLDFGAQLNFEPIYDFRTNRIDIYRIKLKMHYFILNISMDYDIYRNREMAMGFSVGITMNSPLFLYVKKDKRFKFNGIPAFLGNV